MINELSIKNFKSIKDVNLRCRRVNIFIGEPNTGKSNIQEVLGLLSHVYYGELKNFVRFENMSNLFFDQDLEQNVNIKFDQKQLEIKFENGLFVGDYFNGYDHNVVFGYNYGGTGHQNLHGDFSQFKFYRFVVRSSFTNRSSEFLIPPYGDNLLEIIRTRKELRKIVQQIFGKFGYRFVIEIPEYKIKIMKDLEDVVISIPYSVVSDTLQRLIFHLTAIYSNKKSVIVFQEPESHAFPYYTKYLAERIALDPNGNQYFISTHNPYFLLSILEKTVEDEVRVYITYMENYQTKVKPLKKSDIEEILDQEIDVFFNIERFLV